MPVSKTTSCLSRALGRSRRADAIGGQNQDVPPTDKKKDMRAFLGLVTYYGRFIEGMATIAAPLYDSLRHAADDRIECTEDRGQAFERLRQALTLCAPYA